MICPGCEHDNLPGEDICASCLMDLAPLDWPEGYDLVESAVLHDSVQGLLTRLPVCVHLGATLVEALRVMLDESIGSVLVVDEAGQLVGILTERDFLTDVVSIPDYAKLLVDDFMTAKPETLCPRDTLAVALCKMDVGGYRHLPVVERGRPLGILSVRDVMAYLTRFCETFK